MAGREQFRLGSRPTTPTPIAATERAGRESIAIVLLRVSNFYSQDKEQKSKQPKHMPILYKKVLSLSLSLFKYN